MFVAIYNGAYYFYFYFGVYFYMFFFIGPWFLPLRVRQCSPIYYSTFMLWNFSGDKVFLGNEKIMNFDYEGFILRQGFYFLSFYLWLLSGFLV